jgi:hypothetical protein
MDSPLDTNGSVILDATGAGRVLLGPRQGQLWLPQEVIVQTTTTNKLATCVISIGHATVALKYIDDTVSGYGDVSSKISGQQIYPGTYVWAVWSGGNPGDYASLTIHGTQRTGYRAGGK